MLKFIFFGFLVIVAAVLGIAATRSDELHVVRSVTMRATPDAIFPLINSFHDWRKWSPYESLDPDMTREYAGPQTGPGAIYQWTGNGKVGQGRMEIIEVLEPTKLLIQLDMKKPVAARNMVEFTIEPRGESSLVTWSMTGKNTYLSKFMGLFFDMDKMIGGDFEAGLANIKKLVER